MADESISVIDLIEKMAGRMSLSLLPMRTAGDIMNTKVKMLTLDHKVKAFCSFMENYRVRHAPVVDYPDGDKSSPEFIGIVSERDVLRLGLPRTEEIDPLEIDLRAMRQLLTQVVARKPKSVSPTASIPEVIETMLVNHVDIVPVQDETGLVGIITTTDILRRTVKLSEAFKVLLNASENNNLFDDLELTYADAARAFHSFAQITAGDAMTADVVSLGSTDVLGNAKNMLQQHRFRHMPIVDEQGVLVGIISDRDILRQLPFAGRRPPKDSGEFRSHLFKIDKWSISLKMPLEQIMTRQVSCILAEAKLSDAALAMRKQKIGCLAVVEGDRKLCGIITVVDIMRSLLPLYEVNEVSLSREGAGDFS
jgi:CBS domain-containing protein